MPRAHNYGWRDVLERTLDDVQAGDTFFTPEAGLAYYVAADGAVTGVGWQPLPDSIWEVVTRDDLQITVIDPDGHEISGPLHPNRTILRVKRADDR